MNADPEVAAPSARRHGTTRRVVGNAAALAIGRATGDVAMLAFMLLYARAFGAAELGHYALAMAVAGLLSIATSLGLNTVLQRELSRAPERSRELVGTIFLPQVAAAAVSGGLIVVASFFVADAGAARQTIWIIGAYQVLSRLAQSVSARLAAHEEMATWSALEAAHKVGILVIAWAGLRASWDPSSVLLAYPVMGASLLIAAWLTAGARHGTPVLAVDVGAWRPMLALGLPFLAIQFVLEFYDRIGIVLLESAHGVTATGLYAAADRPLTIFTAGLNLVAGAMLPAMSRLFRSDRRQLGELYGLGMRSAFLASLPLACVISLEADAVAHLLYGQQFAGSAPVLAVLAWTLPLLALRFIACAALIATNQQGFLFRMECAAALTYTLAAWALVLLAGGLALAACKLGSVIAFAGIAAIRVARSGIGGGWHRCVPWAVAALLGMLAAHSATAHWGPIASVSAACAAYALVVLSSRCLRRN